MAKSIRIEEHDSQFCPIKELKDSTAELISDAVQKTTEIIEDTASNCIEKAKKTARDAGSSIDERLQAVKENSKENVVKRAQMAAFRHGINKGAELAAKKGYAYYFGLLASLLYAARADEVFSDEEKEFILETFTLLRNNKDLPQRVRKALDDLSTKEEIGFESVAICLDPLSIENVLGIVPEVKRILLIDEPDAQINEAVIVEFQKYIGERISKIDKEDNLSFNAVGTNDEVEKAVAEYGCNIDRINQEFKAKTKLQESDLAFLFGATMLQVARIYLVDSLTSIEKAGKGEKEEFLHEAQGKILSPIEKLSNTAGDILKAPTSQILTRHGVPYDVTKGGKPLGVFKGANHRFATLGHDPALGLIFGTANILTNTATFVGRKGFGPMGIRLPITACVEYGPGFRHPEIAEPIGTLLMLKAAGSRVIEDPAAGAAALIKQIVHIGTDLYTPAGIQLPLANILLDNAHAELLTKYVSTGDLLKIGANAGLAEFINWLIASLHGCSLVFSSNGTDFCQELYQARTKKILSISNCIASSSSVVAAAITKDVRKLDIGGFAITCRRLFTDTLFISKLKYEYLNTELGIIYEHKADGLL